MIIIKKNKNKKIITDIKVFKIIYLIISILIIFVLIFISNNFQINLNIFSIEYELIVIIFISCFSILYYFYIKEKIIIDNNKNTLEFKNKSIKIDEIEKIYYKQEITPIYQRNRFNTNKYYYSIFLINKNNEEEILIEKIIHEKNVLIVLNELEKVGILVDKEIKITNEGENNEDNFNNSDFMGNELETEDVKKERVGIDDTNLSEKEIENKVDEILDEEDRNLNHK